VSLVGTAVMALLDMVYLYRIRIGKIQRILAYSTIIAVTFPEQAHYHVSVKASTRGGFVSLGFGIFPVVATSLILQALLSELFIGRVFFATTCVNRFAVSLQPITNIAQFPLSVARVCCVSNTPTHSSFFSVSGLLTNHAWYYTI
jgi:hypothetical protein